MNVTELAHWRYRVKAITADIAQIESDRRSSWSSPYLYYPFPISDDPEDTAKYEAKIARHEASILARHEVIQGELDYNHYLLEEARYKVELGEVLSYSMATNLLDPGLYEVKRTDNWVLPNYDWGKQV